jgi:hypothetical protein
VDRFTLIKEAQLAGFFDEFEKLAKTVLMKKLSPAAKKLMDRMTGATRGASIPQPKSARRLRHALTGKKSPELMTEMHGMKGMLSPAEQAAKRQSQRHFEGVLKSQGKVYKAAPGTEAAIGSIAGHPRALTRTGARVSGTSAGTVASKPGAIRARQALGTAPTHVGTAHPISTAHTIAAGPGALRRAA